MSTVYAKQDAFAGLITDYDPSWNALAKRVHLDNCNKGFWPDEGRNFGEIIALMYSELTEAFEGWNVPDKSKLMDEKVPQYYNAFVEIADCAIRLLDMLGIYDSDIDTLNTHDYISTLADAADKRFVVSWCFSFEHNLSVIGKYLGDALEADRKGRDFDRVENLEHAFMACIAFLEEMQQPAREIIDAKLAYNRSRPFKHGKAFG